MTEVVQVIVRERLASSTVDQWTRAVLLAAFDGEDRLDAVLTDGGTAVTVDVDADADHGKAPSEDSSTSRVWLTGVRVEGFRGVAQTLKLDLVPGPGLVLVTGRNGSGKSSLAEAAELALSGTSGRAQTRLWAKGLRNLHYGGSTSVAVSVRLDGLGDVSVGMTLPGDGLAGGSAWATRDGADFDIDALGWAQAVARYRPVLTYSELAQLSAEQPSALFDPLNRILGLEALTEADKTLRAAEAKHGQPGKDAVPRRKAVLALLETSGDERAAPLREALLARGFHGAAGVSPC